MLGDGVGNCGNLRAALRHSYFGATSGCFLWKLCLPETLCQTLQLCGYFSEYIPIPDPLLVVKPQHSSAIGDSCKQINSGFHGQSTKTHMCLQCEINSKTTLFPPGILFCTSLRKKSYSMSFVENRLASDFDTRPHFWSRLANPRLSRLCFGSGQCVCSSVDHSVSHWCSQAFSIAVRDLGARGPTQVVNWSSTACLFGLHCFNA